MVAKARQFSIRYGKVEDINVLLDLTKELQEHAPPYQGIPIDDSKWKRTLAMLMGSRLGCVFVIADETDTPVGFVAGAADEFFFSKRRVVSDLCTYVQPAARGYAGGMIRRFVRWGRSVPGVVAIMPGISSGSGEVGRVARIYEHLGFDNVGSIHMMRIDEGEGA